MILSRGRCILFKITETQDWQPMELLKICKTYIDPTRVQFLDHDGQLALLVIQYNRYDTWSDGDTVVGLNM
jgi:hypothetical protein